MEEPLSHSGVMLTPLGTKRVWYIEVYSGKPKCRDCGVEIKNDDFYCPDFKRFWCGLCEKADIGYRRCYAHITFILRRPTTNNHTHYRITLTYKKEKLKEEKLKKEEVVDEYVDSEDEGSTD